MHLFFNTIIITLAAIFVIPAAYGKQDAYQKEFSHLKKKTFHCPEPDRLKLDNNRKWYVPHSSWKSYDTSFTTKIKRFIGAQWQGVVVGRVMICRYTGKGGDFPVTLQMTGHLIPEPKGQTCKPNDKGVKNCKFKVLVPRKKKGDLFDNIKYYRNTDAVYNKMM